MNMGLTYWIFISKILEMIGRRGAAKRKSRNWRRNDGEENSLKLPF